MSDLLTTCYGDHISISRPQLINPSLDNSFEDERETSPIHLSSAISVSSGISSFSRRLATLNKKTNEENNRSIIGRGRGMNGNSSQMDDIDDQKRNNSPSPTPSIANSSKFLFSE